MPTPIDLYRQKFPEYDDLSDEQITKGLYRTRYSDLDFNRFRQSFLGVQPGPVAEEVPPLLQRAAADIAAEDGEWQNALKPEPKDRSDVVGALESVARGVTQQAKRVADLGEQVIAGYNEYMANRATAQAFEAANRIEGVADLVTGVTPPDIEGEGFIAIERTRARRERAQKAREGDPEAQEQIRQEMAQHYEEARAALQTAISNRTERIAAAREIPMSEVTGRMMAADNFSDAIEVLKEDPIRIMTEIAARSLPNSAEGIILGAIGALMGGVGGLALGAAAGSAMTEYRASFAEALEAEGVNLTDSESILTAIQDPTIMARVKEKSLIRAGIIGTLDGASAGIASKTLTPFVKGAVSRLIANQGAQVASQAALGAAGEAAAQLATEGKIRPGEVLAEGIGEGPTAIVDTAVASVTGVSGQQAQESVRRVTELLERDFDIRPPEDTPATDELEARLPEERFREDPAAEAYAREDFDDIERLVDDTSEEGIEELGQLIARARPEVFEETRQRIVEQEEEQPLDVDEETYRELALGIPGKELKKVYERSTRREPTGYAEPAVGPASPAIHTLADKRAIAARKAVPATQDLTGALEETLTRLEAGEPIRQITGAYTKGGARGSLQIDDPARAETARVVIGIQGIDKVREEFGPIGARATKIAVLEALSQRDVVVKRGEGDTFVVVAQGERNLRSAVELAHAVLSTQTLSTPYGLQVGLGVEVRGDVQFPSGPERKKRGLRAVWGVEPNPTRRMDADPDVLFAEEGGAGANWVPYIGRDGELPLNSNSEYVLGNGRTVRIPKKPVNKRHILERLERSFGLTIYRGKMKSDMLQLGFFRIGTGEIRIRNASETEVAAHEVGHWLDYTNPWIRKLYKQYEAELVQVSYNTDKLVEGYAEFMRLFFTQDSEAQRVAPGFYDAFVKELEAHPDLAAPVYDIQEMMHAWAIQGVRNRAIGRFAGGMTAMDKIKARIPSSEDLVRRGLDGLRTFRTAEQFVTDGKSIQAYNMLRVAQGGSSSIMHAAFHYATPRWNRNFTGIERSGESLQDVFGGHFGDEELGLYMLGRHAQEAAKRGESGFRQDEIEDMIKIGKERPEFVEIYDRFLAFTDRMLEFAQQSGLVNKGTLEATRESVMSFVPLHRVIDAIINENPVKPGGTPGRENVGVIWENMLGSFSQLIRSSLVNAGMRRFFEIIGNSKNQKGARWATKTPVQPLSKTPTKKALDTVGLTKAQYDTYRAIPEAAPEAIRAALAQLDKVVAAGNPIVEVTRASLRVAADGTYTYYDNGRRIRVEIGDPGLIESIQSLAPHQINMWVAIMGGASTLIRRGVTSTPSFAVANLARDSLNAWTMTKGDRLPVAGALRGIGDTITASPMYQDMLLNGGGFANFTQAAEAHRKNIVDPRSLIARWDDILGRFENANRLARYRSGQRAGESKLEAAIGARDISTDFSMRGSSKMLRTVFTVVPFMNARIQGLWRIARIKEDGLLWSYMGRGTALMIAGLALYAMNRDDERYKELPDEIRDLYWVFFTGPGEDEYLLLPKPFETGMLFGTIPERIFQLLEERNGKDFADALSWMFLETFALDFTPQIFKPLLELDRNRNFAGAPIVPEHTVGADPGEQWSYYTSESLRRLGRKFPKYFSPAKAEHLIRGYLGTIGGYALGASDAMLRWTVGPIDDVEPPSSDSWRDSILVRGLGKSFVPRAGPPRRTKSTDEYYDMVREIEQVARTIALRDNRELHRLEEYLENPENAVRDEQGVINRDYRQELSDLRQDEADIRLDKKLSGEEKKVKIWEIRRARQAVYRDAVAEMRKTGVQFPGGGQ